MNPAVAPLITESLMKGIFDVLDAMLSKSFTQEPGTTQDVNSGLLKTLLNDHPMAFQCTLAEGLGGLVLLLRTEDGDLLSSSVEGGKDELARQILDGASRSFLERCGKDAAPIEDVTVHESAVDAADTLNAFLGEGAGALTFTYTDGEALNSRGVLLYADNLESIVTEDLVTESKAAIPDATLSSDEMTDILSGFGPGEAEAAAPAATIITSQDNINRVLDIRLLATARLGRVELPISEILNFGPGSIIEVGHLVDEPIELLINDKLVAKGDVVVVDEKFGIRITEIISPEERIESLS